MRWQCSLSSSKLRAKCCRVPGLIDAAHFWLPLVRVNQASFNMSRLTLLCASASFAQIIRQVGFAMEKIQRRFGAGIAAWLRTAVAEEGCTRGSSARGHCEFAG